MTVPRRHLVDPHRPCFYHLISRCVRRARLCGQAKGHRRRWIRARLELLVDVFPVEIASFAIMDNHLHLVARYDPQANQRWTDEEVLARQLRLRPELAPTDPEERAEWCTQILRDPSRLARWRKQLGSLGWFMRELKYWIARRANAEDEVTGHFWEARYRSIPLLDQAALTACMAYVDLNPIRAGTAATPEESTFTSIRERIGAHRSGIGAAVQVHRALDRKEVHPRWLLPVAACVSGALPGDNDGLALETYLELVDVTGRALATGKRGRIDPALTPILQRIGCPADRWESTMSRGGQMLGSAIGQALARSAEATRRSVRWVVNRCPLFLARPPLNP